MDNKSEYYIWDVENFHLFGAWLISKNIIGHGLLCIIGPAFGFKIGELLTLTWNHLIDYRGSPYGETYVPGNERKRRRINNFVSHYISIGYDKWRGIREYNPSELVFTYTVSGLPLSTSNLNKELKRYFEQFKSEMEEKYSQIADFRQPKTSSFEIAWARNLVKQYNYTKKSFSTVSKELGHPSVQYTVKLLEIEPNDIININCADYNPDLQMIEEIDYKLESGKDGTGKFYQFKLLKSEYNDSVEDEIED